MSFIVHRSSFSVKRMAKIQINGLTKRFGNVVAVRDLSLDIADREFLVLLGPSGAGKTTTLRCVAGVETPSAGDIAFDGQLMNSVSPAERDVAFVFQTYALYPRKTVYENIAFPLEARNLSRAQIEASVREVTDQLHITRLLDRRPAQLSGGEQQRVALGRAMVRRPRAFLMDEPLTNLDAALRADMRAELKHLQHELAPTMVYVTNDQIEAMSMGQRIVVMNRGLLQQIGTPLEVYARPATLFVAGFIGSPPMRLVDCRLQNGGAPALVNSSGTLRLPIDQPLADRVRASGAEQLVAGVR